MSISWGIKRPSLLLPTLTSKQLMALRAVLAVRQSSLLGWTSLGAFTIGLVAVNGDWRSIALRSSRYINISTVTPHYYSLRSLHSASQGLFSALTSSTMSSLIPPQPAPTWTHTADDVMRLTKETIAMARGIQDEVATLPPRGCNMSSVSDFERDASND